MIVSIKPVHTGRNIMCFVKKGFLWFSFMIAANFCLFPPAVQAEEDVCSRGTGLPPFLGSGVDPNLLLVLDNSGSMLDMAYIDKDRDEAGPDRQEQCFDEGYLLNDLGTNDTSMKYEGPYDRTKWYKWQEGKPVWRNTSYTKDALVYSDGIIFRALNSGTSSGISIYEDSAVQWDNVLRPSWKANTYYHAYSFVFDNVNDRVWYTASGGTSNATATSADSDTSVTWVEIKRWQPAKAYSSGTFVTWDDFQLYYTGGAGTSNGSQPLNDEGVTWQRADYNSWRAGIAYRSGDVVTYNSMIFQAKYSSGGAAQTHTASGTDIYADGFSTYWERLDEGYFSPVDSEAEAQAYCSAATGTNKYKKVGHACITINHGVSGSTSDQVTAFAASGNFLNWAMASKFDIQKKILTGGKYDEDNQRLISENRGCAGNRFIKQVRLDGGKYLTLSVRGANATDKVDSIDDTGRLEIFAVTDNGIDFENCQDAIDAFNDPTGVGPAEQAVADCVGFSATGGSSVPIEHIIYHKAIQECWYYAKHGSWKGGNDHPLKTCPELYNDGVSPLWFPSTDPAYICWGKYDSGPHDQREGYVGRCWQPASTPLGTCVKKPCSATAASYPWYFTVAGDSREHRCLDAGSEDICSGNFNTTQKSCNKEWFSIYWDTSTTPPTTDCTPAATAIPAGWSTNLNGDAIIPDADAAEKCVDQAMHDFCRDLEVPEVIDPSDEATETTNYWNLPAILVDSGLVGQLDRETPLLVMKGQIKWNIPAEQTTDVAEKPNGPRGVLYDVAQVIRVGIMALNDNGSLAECSATSSNNPSIIKYCPAANKDGARVISQIKQGMYFDDMGTPGNSSDDKENWDHYTEVVASINATRAISWTPLAEAIYTALGYYGQNKVPRIDPLDLTDYKLPNEDTAADPWTDPVQYWCQDNHVLIITEGASTADVNAIVATFAKAHGESSESTEAVCTGGLEGSPYLDNLTYFGQNATVEGATADVSNLYTKLIATNKPAPDPAYAKQPVTTHIVTTGSLRTDGTGECSPATLMTNAADNGGSTLLTGEDPAQLEANLKSVLSGILGRASAGSAASVISSSRSGEGAVYQAVFWPKVDRALGEDPLTWIGDVHGLFIDNQGRMWDDNLRDATLRTEDKDGDGRLDAGEDIDPDGTGPEDANGCLDGDRRIFFYYDGENSKICFNDSVLSTTPPVCNTAVTGYCQKAGEPLPLKSFDKYLWSANQELQDIVEANLHVNRAVDADGRWDWNSPSRYIFTWNDLDNDGIVDSNGMGGSTDEVIPLDDTVNWATKTTSHHSILDDFKVATATEMGHFRDWLRGLDTWYEVDTDGDNFLDSTEDLNNNGVRDYVYRCRRGDCDPANAATNPEWRLGDVVHSTPKLVAQPAEAFHTIYRDPSYSSFVKRHRYRRNVIYFGANDGMLHAVNGGFYKEDDNKFYKNMDLADDTGKTAYNDNGPELGTEMWAYIPYNLQPHLKCLTDPLYGGDDGNSHKYFVDKEPRIFDMRIFTEEPVCATDPYDKNCVHPKGWGTILVGALRFGGASITAATEGTWESTDNRQFISSYFILDITDPERPPKLLGELTRTSETDTSGALLYADLGFSTPMPTGVVMRGSDGTASWYLVFGNGPTTIKGENSQKGKVAVLPMKLNAAGILEKGFRIPAQLPSVSTGYAGAIPVQDSTTDTKNRFISDLMTVDYDLESKTNPTYGALYKSDAIYFGTVDGTAFTEDLANPGITTWTGGGGIYRLVTEKITAGEQDITTPDEWYLSKFVDTKAPVTGGLSVGWDNANFWVYFGTGRYFATEDKTDASVQRFFGVKEPLYTNCGRTWGSVGWSGITPTPAAVAGLRGLVRTDNIKVVEKGTFATYPDPVVFCPSGTNSTDITLPNYCRLDLIGSPLGTNDGITYYRFEDLRKYIAGEGRETPSSCLQSNSSIGVDGWYRVLQDPRERVTGQSALLGGLVTFTTYQPFDDLCIAEGMSNLYGVHYQTGTAWYENVFGTVVRDSRTVVLDKLSLGVGLATTPSMHSGGGGNDAKAFIQSSTGEIIEIEQENLPIQPPKSGAQSWCDDCD